MHKTELIRNNQFSPLLFCNVEVLRYLKILGLALITVSLLYLMAANWWMLPDPVQLAIPMLILLCSATASIYFDQQEWVRQSLDTVSGLMLGLSLAMIGQIYQIKLAQIVICYFCSGQPCSYHGSIAPILAFLSCFA
jgi:uncharacterized membrane protein|nr:MULTISPECIES: DUF2157 domain-containing protein [Acinetobacter]